MSRGTTTITLVMLVLVAALAGCARDDGDPASGRAAAEPSWSDGRTIWWGDHVIETGSARRIRTFTHTADAVVWIDSAGAVHSSDGTDRNRIGDAGDSDRLRADRFGSLVAWMEVPGRGQAALVVWDTARGEEVLRTTDGLGRNMRTRANFYTELTPWPPRDRRPIALVQAVDGDTVWWLGTEGTMRTVVSTGETETVVALDDGADEWTVLAAADGQVLSRPFDPDDPEALSQIEIRESPAEEGATLGGASAVRLAPDASAVLIPYQGRWTARGTAPGSVVSRYPEDIHAGVWLDDDRFTALRLDGRGPGDIVICRASGPDCTPYADRPGRRLVMWPGHLSNEPF